MQAYTPRRHRPWALLAGAIRAAVYLLKHWPLLLIVAAIISPISPHVMISYRISGETIRRDLMACRYIGVHGLIDHRPAGFCPAVALIDRREVAQ